MNRFVAGDIVETYDGIIWKIEYPFKHDEKYYAEVIEVPSGTKNNTFSKGHKGYIEDKDITGKSNKPELQQYNPNDYVKTKDGVIWKIEYVMERSNKYYATVVDLGNKKTGIERKVGQKEFLRNEDIEEKATDYPPRDYLQNLKKKEEPVPEIKETHWTKKIRAIVRDEINKAVKGTK